MIPFEVWLSQIVGYGHFITDTLGVRRAWVDNDYSRTSVTNFDELYEQIFDDLDSDTFETNLRQHLPVDPGGRDVLTAFLGEIRAIDALRSHDSRYLSAVHLLKSEEWGRLVEAARRLTSTFPLSENGK